MTAKKTTKKTAPRQKQNIGNMKIWVSKPKAGERVIFLTEDAKNPVGMIKLYKSKVEQHILKIMAATSGTTCTMDFDTHDHTLIRAMAKRFEHTIDGDIITFDLSQERVRRENLKPLVNAIRIDTEGNLHIPPSMSGASVQRWKKLNAQALTMVRENIEIADPSTLEPTILEKVTEATKGHIEGFSAKKKTEGYMVSIHGYEVRISTGRRSVHLAQKAAAMLQNMVGGVIKGLRLIDGDELTPEEITSLTLGGWVDEGYLYLDLSLNVKSWGRAKKIGSHFNQIAVYDCTMNQTVRLG